MPWRTITEVAARSNSDGRRGRRWFVAACWLAFLLLVGVAARSWFGYSDRARSEHGKPIRDAKQQHTKAAEGEARRSTADTGRQRLQDATPDVIRVLQDRAPALRSVDPKAVAEARAKREHLLRFLTSPVARVLHDRDNPSGQHADSVGEERDGKSSEQ